MHQTQSFVIATAAVLLLAPLTFAANRRQTTEQLAADADKVVLGTVNVKTSRWGDDSRIYTDVVVSPDVTIKGKEEGPVTVRVLGGIVGDTEMTVSDGPEFQEGRKVVLFLKRNGDHFEVAGRDAGKYDVETPEAADAAEHAFAEVEKTTGHKQTYKRALTQPFLSKHTTGETQDQLTSTTSTSSTQTGCYDAPGAKWGVNSIPYRISSNVSSTWTPSIQAAAGTWSAAGAAFQFANDQNSTNEVIMADLVTKYGSSYSNTYAVTTTWSTVSTNQITKATIEVNTSWQWSTTGQANMADVQNILTHEFGHWMRLLDIYSPTTCSEVTMWGTAMLGETKKRTLDQADIDGLVKLYGRSLSLGTPALVSPANNATSVPTAPVLSWSAATGAVSYDVYLGTGGSPAYVATVSGTSYQAASLAPGTTYSWRVVAKNSTATAASATWVFTTASSSTTTMTPVTLYTPANGATGLPLSMNMSWSAVAGATSYDLYIGTTSNPSYIGSVPYTSVTVSGFANATTYYWKVVARGSSGSSSSPVWWFRTY